MSAGNPQFSDPNNKDNSSAEKLRGPGTPHYDFQRLWNEVMKEHDKEYYDKNYSGMNREGYMLDKDGKSTNLLASHTAFVVKDGLGSIESGRDVVIRKFEDLYPGVAVPSH